MFEKYFRFLIMTVFFLPLVLTSYNYISVFNDSSSGGEPLNNMAFRLIRTCFADNNRLITLSGNVGKKLAEEIYKSEFTAVTITSNEAPPIDEIYTMAKQSWPIYENNFYFRFEHKAQGFILASASSSILRHQIKELKNSRWWNAGGLFVIIDDGTPTFNSCKNAQRFLWIAWRSNMLSSVFLCRDTNEGLMMYSYDPYNGMARKSWLKVGRKLVGPGHPWILFKRNASGDTGQCGEIFFDKTKNLNGYKIRSNAVQLRPRLLINYNKTGTERYGGEEGKTLQTVFRFLDASVEEIPYTGNDPLGYLDDNGTYFGMLSDVFSGRVDIGLNERYMVKMRGLGTSYPHTTGDVCFVVKSKGNLPQWMNIAFEFDLWIGLGLLVVILLTTAVLGYHSDVTSGSLNALRLVISASLVRLPSQLPARLFLINVLSMFLVVNGTFQGRLVSLLTKPRAYQNPETQTDLGEAGYEVLGYPPFLKFIDDPTLRSNFRSIYSLKCIEKIFDGEHIACLIDCDSIYVYNDNRVELHTLSQRLQFHLIFVTSTDWPLLDKFNQIVRRLAEGGFPAHWKAEYKHIYVTRNYGAGAFERYRSPRLSLADLAFIFHWLLLGLHVAALVFLCEVIGARYNTKFKRTRTTL